MKYLFTTHPAFFILCAVATGLSAATQPNVILLMGDDHGWEETGYNGHAYLKTPALDAMAASGLRLDRFYSATASCSPTRGSVMTGRHPNRYGTFYPGFSLRPGEITIAQLLQRAGYATAHFGKWHLGPVKASSPTNPGAMGFDQWLSHDNFFEMNPSLSRNGGAPEIHQGESSELIVAHAIEFIKQATEADRPFFVVIWYGSPHEPYSGLEKDLALYDNLPEAWSKRSVSLTSNETGKRTTRPLRDVLQERFAEITAMDRSIGNLRDYLKHQGLQDDTLLWYCGDNGIPPSGLESSRFRNRKGSIYEGGTRVPGVIEWPARIPAPRISQMSTVTSDILPTLCDLAGIDLPERPLDGISLAPVIEGRMDERHQPICFWNFQLARTCKKGVVSLPLHGKKGVVALPLWSLTRLLDQRDFLVGQFVVHGKPIRSPLVADPERVEGRMAASPPRRRPQCPASPRPVLPDTGQEWPRSASAGQVARDS